MADVEVRRVEQVFWLQCGQRGVEEGVIAGLAVWDTVRIAVVKEPWVMVVCSHFRFPLVVRGMRELYHAESFASSF